MAGGGAGAQRPRPQFHRGGNFAHLKMKIYEKILRTIKNVTSLTEMQDSTIYGYSHALQDS